MLNASPRQSGRHQPSVLPTLVHCLSLCRNSELAVAVFMIRPFRVACRLTHILIGPACVSIDSLLKTGPSCAKNIESTLFSNRRSPDFAFPYSQFRFSTSNCRRMLCVPAGSGIKRRRSLLIQQKFTALVDALPCSKFEFNQLNQFQFSLVSADNVAPLLAQIPRCDPSAS